METWDFRLDFQVSLQVSVDEAVEQSIYEHKERERWNETTKRNLRAPLIDQRKLTVTDITENHVGEDEVGRDRLS